MPNRIIKESICTSDNIDRLTESEEIFFYRLIVNCDDYGRLDARTQILRSKCYPLKLDKVTDEMIEQWIGSLARNKLILLYTVGDKRYLQMARWENHQQIRAKRSKYPSIDEGELHMISDDIRLNQEISYVPVIQSNPIQSESNLNPNPIPVQVPYEEVRKLFSEICKSFSQIKTLSANRKKAISARWNIYKSLDTFRELFTKAEASDFLKGKNDRNWTADFDWLLKDSNMTKVLEGKYDNKNKPTQLPTPNKHKTKFHLPESRGEHYSADELEAIVLANQKRKLGG